METRWRHRLAAGVLGVAILLGAAPPRAGAQGKALLQVQGEFTNKDDRDKAAPNCYCKVYPFQMQAGKEYQIDLKSKDFDAFLRLEDPSGKEVASDDDSGGDLNSRIIYKAPTTGGYKIVVSTFRDNETGKFSLTVVEVGGGGGAGGKTLTFPKGGQSTVLQGQLTNADPTDGAGKRFTTYSFQAKAGNVYRFEMTGLDGLDPYVRIEDASGKIVREEEFGDGKVSRVSFTAPQAGTFKVVATTFKEGMTGGYKLTASEVVTGPATQITFKKGQSTTIQGQLTNADPTDGQGKHFKAYSFPAKAGATYRFEVAGQGGLDPYARIEDASGKVVREEEFGDGKVSRVSFTAGQAGTFRLIATTFKEGMTGPFTLTASEIGAEGGPVAQAGPITFKAGQPTVIQGQLTNADPTDGAGKHFKAFPFQGQAGKTYQFEMAGQGGLDAFVRVEDASGKILREEEFGDGKVSRLSFTAPQAGSYKLIATTYKAGLTGGFTLTATEVGNVPATPISFQKGQPTKVQGNLAAGDPKDGAGKHFKAYSFQAKAGATYRFEVAGAGGLDPYARIEDASGKVVREEEFGDGKVSRVSFTAGQAGTFKVIATSFKEAMTGAFTLTASEEGTAVEVAKDGQINLKGGQASVIKGSLGGKDPKDGQGKHFKAFAFQAEVGKTYRFELTGQNGLDPFLRLEDGAGKPLRNEDFGDGRLSRITFSPVQPGTYKIVVSSFKGGITGDFTLTATELRGSSVGSPDIRREDLIRDPRRDPP